jgi:hypothetical protein
VIWGGTIGVTLARGRGLDDFKKTKRVRVGGTLGFMARMHSAGVPEPIWVFDMGMLL